MFTYIAMFFTIARNRTTKRTLFAAGLALLATSALAGGVREEVLQLPSDPPGRIIEAPGGGHVTTPAVLFTPTEGGNIHGPAIVMLSTGARFVRGTDGIDPSKGWRRCCGDERSPARTK